MDEHEWMSSTHASYHLLDSLYLKILPTDALLYAGTTDDENYIAYTIVEQGRPKYTMGLTRCCFVLDGDAYMQVDRLAFIQIQKL